MKTSDEDRITLDEIGKLFGGYAVSWWVGEVGRRERSMRRLEKAGKIDVINVAYPYIKISRAK